jgi:glycosyltransferase involved in cell wall biosynthesis
MKPLFAILICHLPEREQLLNRVMDQLTIQRKGHEDQVKILINTSDRSKTTGAKRNELLDWAKEENASHIAFVDDDDLVSPNYIERVLPGVEGDFDCCELWGQYWENNKQFNPFHHSIIHDHWWQDDKFYYRNPNHLSCIKLDLLKNIRFQDKTVGEDAHYSIDIQKAGLLKREYPIKEILYFYFAGSKRDHSKELGWAQARGTTL